MDKPEQDGVWDGDGPHANSDPSPTVICQFEHEPVKCTFPACGCGGMQWPDDALASDKPPIVTVADDIEREPHSPSKRRPKRDRAAYMRDYRARTKATSTQ